MCTDLKTILYFDSVLLFTLCDVNVLSSYPWAVTYFYNNYRSKVNFGRFFMSNCHIY